MGVLQQGGHQGTGREVVRAARVAPELAGVGFTAIARQDVHGKEHEGGDTAGGENTDLGHQKTGEGQVPGKLPGAKRGPQRHQPAKRLSQGKAEDRAERIVQMARRLMVPEHTASLYL
jgi:peptide subunit release factor 1 (eRF1)